MLCNTTTTKTICRLDLIMPIVYKKETGWTIVKPTKEEAKAIEEIGKRMIVEGMSGAYTNERYRRWLETNPVERFFNT